MKTAKMKVLLYLKKNGLDKSGKAPIMGRITIGRSIAQFSCKLSCNPDQWNPRESRMDGKSREAVEVNGNEDERQRNRVGKTDVHLFLLYRLGYLRHGEFGIQAYPNGSGWTDVYKKGTSEYKG